jgi:hypothetical protein
VGPFENSPGLQSWVRKLRIHLSPGGTAESANIKCVCPGLDGTWDKALEAIGQQAAARQGGDERIDLL